MFLILIECACVLVLGQSPLFSKCPTTHTEENRFLAVVLLVVRGHAVVAYRLFPTLLAAVYIMLVTSMLAQCLTVVKLGVTLRAEKGGLHIGWGCSTIVGKGGGVLGIWLILKRRRGNLDNHSIRWWFIRD